MSDPKEIIESSFSTIEIAKVLLPSFIAISIAIGTILFNQRIERKRKIKNSASESLRNFYRPLKSLMDQNGSFFKEFGPQSWSKDDNRREADAELWERIRENYVKRNNAKMADIIVDKFGFSDPTDNIKKYERLLKHIALFNEFHDSPHEKVVDFQFPKGVEIHVREVLNRVERKAE